MRRSSAFIVRLAVFATASFIVACSALPTSPSARAPKVGVSRDGEACDSTVVTDGTCVDGYIIPW